MSDAVLLANEGEASRRGRSGGGRGAVREQWLFTLVAASQRFIADAAGDGESWHGALERLLTSVPAPSGRAEDLLLRTILARLIVLFSRRGRGPRRQVTAMAATVADILINDQVSPREAFLAWGRQVPHRLRRSFHVDLAEVIVRRSLVERLDLRALAAESGCSERAVSLAFQRAYGVSPRTYQRRTKVAAAIRLLRTETWDNDSVARELGYRSPKDLYRVLRIETSLTPLQVRRLSAREADRLLAAIAPGSRSA